MSQPLYVKVLALNRCFVNLTAVPLTRQGALTLFMSSPPGVLLNEFCTSSVIKADR